MLHGDPNGLPFKDWAWEEWRDKYGVKAPWLGKDFVVMANALKALGDEATARAAWTAFLASDDLFYQGHEPGKFLASLSRWAAKTKPKSARRDKMHEDPKWAERKAALLQIYREVAADASIPETEKRDECSRRFRERFPA